jgi:ABC-type lipoprotein release transport system permease subunit
MPWKQVRASLSFFTITSLAIILGSIYFCVAPLYLNTVEKAAFANSLSALGNNLHPQVVTSFAPLSEDAYEEDRGIISATARNAFKESFITSEVYAITPRSSAKMLKRPSVDSVAFFQFQSGYDEYITIVDGRLPQYKDADTNDSSEISDEIEVAIGGLAADKLDIAAGDTIEISAFSGNTPSVITANVTAIIQPTDIKERYWVSKYSVP